MKEKALLPYLHCFWKVSQHSTLTSAANDLHISQPGISYQIRELEQHLGLELMTRTRSKGIMLTSAGQALAAQCQELFTALETSLEVLQGRTLSGSLSFTAPTDFGTVMLAPALGKMSLEHPDLTPHLNITDEFIDLHNDNIDVAFRRYFPDATLHYEPILRITMVMVSSPAYLASSGTLQHINEFSQHNLILHNQADNDWCALLEKVPELPMPSTVSYINDSLARTKATLAGAGMTYLPWYCVEEAIVRGDLIEVLPEVFRRAPQDLYFCCASFAHDNLRYRLVLDYLKDHIEKTGYSGHCIWLAGN